MPTAFVGIIIRKLFFKNIYLFTIMSLISECQYAILISMNNYILLLYIQFIIVNNLFFIKRKSKIHYIAQKRKGELFMFYNRFMEICREYGEKPTPVLKKLDISPGNLKRWEGGASITAETLEKIANYSCLWTISFSKMRKRCLLKFSKVKWQSRTTRTVFVRFTTLHVSTPTTLQAF